MVSPVDAATIDEVRDRIARGGGGLTPETVAAALRERGSPVGDRLVLAVHDALMIDVIGAGPLEHLLALEGVTDVLVNGPRSVWIDRGQGLEEQTVAFADDEAVRRLAQRLAAAVGRRLDDATPFVDAQLPGGTRLHAVLAPLARPGTAISLRVPQRTPLTLSQLEESGFADPDAVDILRALIRCRAALLITGGTGSGKTTLLDALLGVVDRRERIVVIEDSAELRPDHPHVVHLEARPPNVEGAGAVPLSALVRQSLRMRPDRVVVGEVRGAEVVDLLAAMNTGHEGGICTVHANAAADVPARVEALALAAGLSRSAAHSQLASAFDAVVHLRREGSNRHLAEIGVLRRGASKVVVETAIRFVAGRSHPGPGAALLRELIS